MRELGKTFKSYEYRMAKIEHDAKKLTEKR